MTDGSKEHTDSPAEPSVRAREPAEDVQGNREVPRATDAAHEQVTQEQEQDPREESKESGGVGEIDVAALQAERDEFFDRLQRLAAEFDNFRKRSVREQAAMSSRANERLVKELLPILDDLGRALEAGREHEEAKVIEGVELVGHYRRASSSITS